MNQRILAAVAIVLVALGFLGASSLFIVDQTEQALVLQLGQPRRVLRDPGLYAKLPFVQNVIYYEKRLLDFEPPPEEVIASDQKRLVVDSYTRYRVVDPLLFYQTVNSEAAVRARLSALVSGSLRRVIGNVTLASLLSAQRPEIMHQIRDEVSAEAKPFGIDVTDVRIRRADLPAENSQAIYNRMKSERQQQAAQYRGEGSEAAQSVKANAERERTVILAEAQREGQKLRGDGDAQAINIFAKAFGQDEQFFAFYRSLQAYREALNGHDTSFVLTPDSNFFRFFNNGPAGAANLIPPAAPAAIPAPPGTRPRPRGEPAQARPLRLMRDFGTGFALVLVIEGILYALFPEGMKQVAARAMTVPPQILRAAGLLAASVGVVIVWLLRR